MQKKFKNKNYKNVGRKQPTKFVLKNIGIVFDDDTYSLDILDEIIEVINLPKIKLYFLFKIF